MYFVYLCIYDFFNFLLSSWQTFESGEYMSICVCVRVRAGACVRMCVIIIVINNNKQPTTLNYNDKVHKADDSRLFHSVQHTFLNSNVHIICGVFIIDN
jgi:hypothetical protein